MIFAVTGEVRHPAATVPAIASAIRGTEGLPVLPVRSAISGRAL